MTRHSIRWPVFVVIISMVASLTGLVLSGDSREPVIPVSASRVAGPHTLPIVASNSANPDGPSVLTDAQGRFRFSGLSSSSHLLRLDAQTLPASIAANAPALVMTLSPNVTQALAVASDVILRATYHADGTTIDGVLFRDQDGDRRQGPGEPGLPDVRVTDPDIYQYFVPFNDNDLYTSFADVLGGPCLNDPNVSTTIDSTISLTASSNGTTIYYDHWEDGYDPDPTLPGATTETFQANAGGVRLWRDQVNIPRGTVPLLHDGRDRITILGQPAAAVRAAWLTQPGTVLAGAWEMERVSTWGTRYIIPVGEDIGRRGPQPLGDFDYVSAAVMAAYDGTVVQIDADANGTFERTTTINAGQTTYVRGSANQQGFAIVSGATVNATLPVQVQVRAGNCRASYSGRSYTLIPAERWSSDYWSPVASFFTGANGCVVRYLQQQPNSSADVDIYIFNPNPTDLTVTYEDASGTGLLNIPARSTGSYLNLHPNPPVRRSNTQGVHLSAPALFWAVTAVDSTVLGNNGADFDWSYALVPAGTLSPRVVLGWAPGNSAQPPASQPNGSAVYVQAVKDGTLVRADLDANGTYDQFDTDSDGVVEAVSAYGYNELTSNLGIRLNRGQMVRVSNPVTHDMTGAIISAQDNGHPLAVVYGEDACVAGPQNPFLDLGYTVLPLPLPEFSKNQRLLVDADRSGDISPGDTLEYTVKATNNGFATIINPLIIDTLPYTYTDFILGSLSSVPPPLVPPAFTYDNGNGLFDYIPSGTPGTLDPQIHAIKGTYPNLDPSESIIITLRVRLDNQIPTNVLSVINNALFEGEGIPPTTAVVVSPINQVDLLIHKDDGRTVVESGDQLTYTLTYTNAGPGIVHNAVMTDTLPSSAINVSSPTVPGVITPTIEPGRIIFQLGTLPAGYTQQTTITLTLGPGTVDPVVNSVAISTSSSEMDLTNNTSTDIDRISALAVVLSELRADRLPGGVLVNWRTVAELDNYGFHVYRSATPNRADAVRITPAMIPGQGRGLSGAAYSFFDAGAPEESLYYWLEDIDLNGVRTFHGPVGPSLQVVRCIWFLPMVAISR